MSTKGPSRKRGVVARADAINAARSLLLEGGPSAITLKAVGARVGVGHSNLIHHFGSAQGLQSALMDQMVRDLADALREGVAAVPYSELTEGGLLEIVFQVVDKGGAAQLAAWLVLARKANQAASFAAVIRDLAHQLGVLGGDTELAHRTAARVFQVAIYFAFADALIGRALSGILELPNDSALGEARVILSDMFKTIA